MENVTDRLSNPFGMTYPCERSVPGYGDANAHFHVVGDHPERRRDARQRGGREEDGEGDGGETRRRAAVARRLELELPDGPQPDCPSDRRYQKSDPCRPGLSFCYRFRSAVGSLLIDELCLDTRGACRTYEPVGRWSGCVTVP